MLPFWCGFFQLMFKAGDFFLLLHCLFKGLFCCGNIRHAIFKANHVLLPSAGCWEVMCANYQRHLWVGPWSWFLAAISLFNNKIIPSEMCAPRAVCVSHPVLLWLHMDIIVGVWKVLACCIWGTWFICTSDLSNHSPHLMHAIHGRTWTKQ